MRGSFIPPRFSPPIPLAGLARNAPSCNLPPNPRTMMRPALRKILYAVSFEAIGILVGGTALTLLSDASAARSLSLSAFGAGVAMLWSLIFNTGFEAWEARQTTRGRSPRRRAAHAILFEGGLVLILLPATAWWLSTSLWNALTYEAVLIAVFLVYAWAFTWAFDKVFGLPDSAR
ncbi:PACE efflux transporter [bacterium]|nr:PACE efflux transporter [bacterium]